MAEGPNDDYLLSERNDNVKRAKYFCGICIQDHFICIIYINIYIVTVSAVSSAATPPTHSNSPEY